MKILLTFTGANDPFVESSGPGERTSGPVLTVASAQPFDLIHLFSTPATVENSAQTKAELQKRHNNLRVEISDLAFKEPENSPGIPGQLKPRFKKLQKKHPRAEYFICVSSGIPHVDAGWLMLAASGEIQARILQPHAAKFVRAGDGRVAEFDFTNPQAPRVRPFGTVPEADGACDFQSLSDDLCLAGDHAPFLRELKTAFAMAESDCSILLLGETNAGKEAFARLIHCASKRAAKPFITVNCGRDLGDPIESRLFGHLKDALAGADRDQAGAFLQANGGTLFLDELDRLPASSQAKLLRALELGKIQRLGDERETRVNVRVIAATNVDIKEVIAERRPRNDLYQSFYLLRFSAKTKTKWDKLLRVQTGALSEEASAQTNIVPLPSAAGG